MNLNKYMKNKNNQQHKYHSVLPIQRRSQKGFTLLETLVAIFILTLSMTGPVYIASVGFRNTIDSRDNISAQYLAEEVIEVIKNKRDNLSMSGAKFSKPWFEYIVDSKDDDECINDIGSSINKCYMQSEPKDGVYFFNTCDIGDECPNISFDPDGEFNVYGEEDKNNTASDSKFIREFYIEKETTDALGAVSSIKLTVNIKWNDKGRDKVYSLTQRLYDVKYSKFFDELN